MGITLSQMDIKLQIKKKCSALCVCGGGGSLIFIVPATLLQQILKSAAENKLLCHVNLSAE